MIAPFFFWDLSERISDAVACGAAAFRVDDSHRFGAVFSFFLEGEGRLFVLVELRQNVGSDR